MHRARVLTAGIVLGAAMLESSAAAGATQPLVALWKMDETSGTVMRDSVGSHTGTLHSVQLGVPGFKGTAYGFTGSSYVTVPSAGDLNPGSANISITVHLKATSAPATRIGTCSERVSSRRAEASTRWSTSHRGRSRVASRDRPVTPS